MGIQKRLVGSYLAVILITVLILEIFLIVSVKYYYYHNVERILLNQAEISASFFHQYFSDEDLDKQSESLLAGFAQNTAAQVQIISSTGQLLQDTSRDQPGENMLRYPDVQAAHEGNIGTWKGNEPSIHEEILAVSYPLTAKDVNVGVVRFVTSLSAVKETINRIATICIFAGLLVVAIVALLGIVLSRTITGSIIQLKRAAEQMTKGDFTARVEKRYHDELGTLADTLNTMAAKIQRNEQLKNDFITSVSHELRTPLTSIKGWIITLKSYKENGKTLPDDGLEIIDMEADRLTRMVDELLDFSKLDNGRIELNLTPIQMPEFLHYIGKQLAPRASRQNVSMVVQVDDTLPIIQADENRLKQVLINLIDNSLKYTGPGGTIKVSASSREEQVMITVEDTGSGIEEHDLAHVFQKFYKGNNQGAGTGLGLSISQQIIKMHHGDLQIESHIGKGTKVEIYLPK
ncbi:HAMP domain-containing histidine kinase [Paenibacillus albiflavus]|uniref:histidine kinase n=1 Tax=Paenibacillus albiflavus TaxID=2545760 RepID=A0A4R4ELG6_9BACL|nr:HAMP domain-containing sensor histidine kinase [Paenibacillus albiflavus]TCZ80849.1 HAMP domain-containing histidine kinase [Paenibacillus albiflavus]